MRRFAGWPTVFVLLLGFAGCGPDYSPNTYASDAVQKANKVEQGTIVGERRVAVRADGTVGAVTGGAAGGIAGSQVPGGAITGAFGALGGTVIGGIVGTTVGHAAADTSAFEYIVREKSGELLSVTQKDATPLSVGQRVLVITGIQARVVPDYTIAVETAAPVKSGADWLPAAPSGQVAAAVPASASLNQGGGNPESPIPGQR